MKIILHLKLKMAFKGERDDASNTSREFVLAFGIRSYEINNYM